jgi:hypothetical protein
VNATIKIAFKRRIIKRLRMLKRDFIYGLLPAIISCLHSISIIFLVIRIER